MRDLVGICNNRPSLRLSASALAVSKLRFRLRLRLHGVAPQYAMSDGGLAIGSFPTCGWAFVGGCVLNERAVATHQIHSFQNLHRRGICVNFDGSFLSN